MDFNTLIFLGFLALVTILYYLVPKAAKPYLLLLASYVFYLYKPENARLVYVLICATAVTWVCGLALERLQRLWARRALLVLSIAVCLGSLLFYKYSNFFAGIAADVGGLLGGSGKPITFDLVAPLGLSYFSLQSLGYVIDVYRRRTSAVRSPLKYALFVSFFPCIFTGPIERKDHLVPQFDQPQPFDYDRIAGGLFRVLWGYVKKMVIADNLAIFVKAVYSAPSTRTGPMLLAASLLFSWQLYMDFSGSCDIALGAGRMLGFQLTENFARPFTSHSYTELWKRWHISLSSWFQDYLYIPLGGNRCGRVRHSLNLLLTFLASGLWHGANWGFAIWGLLNGLVLVIGKQTSALRKRLAEHNPLYQSARFKAIWQSTCVYLLFTACFVFFAADLYQGSAVAVYTGLFKGWDGLIHDFSSSAAAFAGLGLDLTTLLVTGLTSLLVCFVEALGPVALWVRRRPVLLRWSLYYGLCLVLLFFGAFGQSAFIYQQY